MPSTCKRGHSLIDGAGGIIHSSAPDDITLVMTKSIPLPVSPRVSTGVQPRHRRWRRPIKGELKKRVATNKWARKLLFADDLVDFPPQFLQAPGAIMVRQLVWQRATVSQRVSLMAVSHDG